MLNIFKLRSTGRPRQVKSQISLFITDYWDPTNDSFDCKLTSHALKSMLQMSHKDKCHFKHRLRWRSGYQRSLHWPLYNNHVIYIILSILDAKCYTRMYLSIVDVGKVSQVKVMSRLSQRQVTKGHFIIYCIIVMQYMMYGLFWTYN